jgi:hypothetical protein
MSRCACLLTLATSLLIACAMLRAEPPRLPAGRDTGEPADEDNAPPRTVSADDDATIDRILDQLPDVWENEADLAVTIREVNSVLIEHHENRSLLPWRLAEGYRKSLSAGEHLVPRLRGEEPIAFWQALNLSAMVAGDPKLAARAADQLIAQEKQRQGPALVFNKRLGWAAPARFNAALVAGDSDGCRMVIDLLKQALPEKQHRGLRPMERDAAPIGPAGDFSILLVQGDKSWLATPQTLAGKVVVFDVWQYQSRAYQQAVGFIRKQVYDRYRGYPSFTMIGINRDKDSVRTVRNLFMVKNDMSWPHFYEGSGAKSPISWGVLKSRQIPTVGLLNSEGKVTFVGMPNEPLFHYAVRAALRGANKGEIPQPTTQPDEKTAPPPDVTKAVTPRPEPRPTPDLADKAADEKQAQQKLQVAGLFLSNGFKDKAIAAYQEIIINWPDTDAAVEARAALIRLGAGP